jgi:tetratricopeptide (TPR) repeat protein
MGSGYAGTNLLIGEMICCPQFYPNFKGEEISPFTNLGYLCINKTNKIDMGPGMRKGAVQVSIFALFLCSTLLPFASTTVQEQYVDPFYYNLLQKGESSYLSGNYAQAVRQLKTSLFGLHPDKNLRAKAFIYLSLCHYYLKDIDESETHLIQAINLIGHDGIASLGLTERVMGEISGLAAHFEVGEFTPPEPKPVIVSKPQAETSLPDDPSGESDPDNSIEDLERLIEQDPSDIGRFYHLYELYIGEEDRNNARRTLEKLIKAHPDEIYGLFLLGRMRYRDKKYKDAEEYFRRALQPRPSVTITDDLATELKTYHILSMYHSGDKQKALDMMSVSVHLYTEARIRALPLSSSEKAALREIIREYMKR